MPRQTVPDEIKAAALADLATGEQPAVVAQRYGLDRGLVKQWRRRLLPRLSPTGPTVLPLPHERPAYQMHQALLADLVIQNLHAKLVATQRIAEHAMRPEWLARQTAADVAALFEVLDRSAIDILDRLAGGAREKV